jgi:hypothetical protein
VLSGDLEFPTVRLHIGPRLGVFIWWLGIAVVGSLVAAALVDVAYSRVVYLFVVMPVCGVILFPAAYAANRWLTPILSSWLKR